MSSFYSAFVNTLLFFAPRSNSVQSNTHHAFFAFCPLTSSASRVMILSNAHPEPIRLVSSAGPPVITPQRDSAPCCYFIQHHTRVRVFLAKNYIFVMKRPTNKATSFPRIPPNYCILVAFKDSFRH